MGVGLVVVALSLAGLHRVITDALQPGPVVSLLERLGATGPGAGIVFVSTYALLTLAPVPRGALSLTAGAAFGFGWGVGYAVAGSVLGALAAFGCARRLGGPARQRLRGEKTNRRKMGVDNYAFTGVLAARLTPVIPFTAFNYLAGFSGLHWRPYVAGTLIGVIPGTVGYAAIGAQTTSDVTWSASLALVALAAVIAWSARRAWTRRS